MKEEREESKGEQHMTINLKREDLIEKALNREASIFELEREIERQFGAQLQLEISDDIQDKKTASVVEK